MKKNILNHNSKIIPILIIGMMAVVGVYLLTISKAASPYTTKESEDGALTGSAAIKTDTGASGGKYVQFGQPATPGGEGPTVSYVSPVSLAVVKGASKWQATATDSDGVSKVEFYIDKQLQWTDTTSPYTFQRNGSGENGWDTTLESNNRHILTIKAYDTNNNATSANIDIDIKNPVGGGIGPDRHVLSVDPYKAGNIWYTPLPRTTPKDANSANLVNNFIAQYKAHYGTVSVNTNAFAPTFYITETSTPKYTVGFYNCQNKTYTDKGLMDQLASVPIPSNAMPAPGTDREMIIYDPSTGAMWEMWKATRVNKQWYACWGGKMSNMSQNYGAFAWPYGTTATGLPFLGSTVTIEELQRGVIPHAIAFALIDVRKGGQSWPATRNDGNTGDPNVLWEGQRLRLDPSVDVDALNMHPVGKIMAKAIQQYGMVLRDKAGAVVLYAESSQPYTDAGVVNPYNDLFKGTPSYNILKGFPWDKLQALPKDYGKP